MLALLQIPLFRSRLNTWVQRWTDTVTLPRLVKVVIGRTDATRPRKSTVPLARMHYEPSNRRRSRPSTFAVGSLLPGSLGHVVGH